MRKNYTQNTAKDNNGITYKDFKIGQKVTCYKVDDFVENQHLTVGKTYKIEDLDFHFPDTIVVRSDAFLQTFSMTHNGRVSMFFNIAYFISDVKTIRKLKLQKIEKSK